MTAVEQLKIGNVLFNDVLSTVYLWLYASLEKHSFGVPDTMSCTNQFMPDVKEIAKKNHSGQ